MIRDSHIFTGPVKGMTTLTGPVTKATAQGL
jgi:hypothetical protein